MRRHLWIPVLALAIVAAACGGDSGDGGTDQGAGSKASSTSASSAAPATTTTSRPVPQPVTNGFRSKIYANPARWLCAPDKQPDYCDTDLDATQVAADGTLTPEPFEAAGDPPADCFYLYPTISEDPTPSADFNPGAEIQNVKAYAARFRSICRVFAPIYRQVTVSGLFGGSDASLWDRAAADVQEAWRHYVANFNDGRPVVLIGHSQGGGQIARLIADVIERDPGQLDLIASAMPIGSDVMVPKGELVGGSFTKMPLCSATDEYGCVIAYSSFAADSPPPEGSFFGKPRSGGGETACVNPVDPGADEPQELNGFLNNDGRALTDPAAAAGVTTAWVSYPGLFSATCVRRDGYHYLEITTHSDPADPRRDAINPGLPPVWGLHGLDVNIAQGDLVRTAARQTEAWISAHSG